MFKGQSFKKIGPLPYQVPSTKSQIYNNKETTTISTWYYTWVTSNPDEPAVYVSHKKFLLSSIYIIQSRLGSGEQKRKNRFLNLERGAPSMLYTHGGYLENKGGIIALNTCFIPLIPDTLHSRFRFRKGDASYDQLKYISKMSKYILRRKLYISYPADQPSYISKYPSIFSEEIYIFSPSAVAMFQRIFSKDTYSILQLLLYSKKYSPKNIFSLLQLLLILWYKIGISSPVYT